MTRRTMLEIFGISASASYIGKADPPSALPKDPSGGNEEPTRWERRAQEKRDLTKNCIWLSHEPLIFLQRRGDRFVDAAEQYEGQHAESNLKQLASAGIKYGLIHFYKGFGLEYENADIEKTKAAAAIMHRLGMKVSVYMAGTMFTETFYRELPEAQSWEQRDQNGRWVAYTGAQTYRHYACPNEPAYTEYLKRVLRVAIEEVHADQILFDNIMFQPEPKSCRCPRCIAAFRSYLQRRYPTSEAVRGRFGLPDVDWIRVNEWDVYNSPESLTEIDDPVLQEWIGFRCESLAKRPRQLYEYVKSLNPAVSIGFNIKGLMGYNRMWLNGVYHPCFAEHCDVLTFDTNGMESRLDVKSGAMVSQIRSYKMARSFGINSDDSLKDELHAAVHMAFNYTKKIPGFGYQGGPFVNGGNTPTFNALLEFYREYNDRYYTENTNVADVAIIRNWPSMAYSITSTLIPTILTEQVLIQYKIPFDLLHEEQMDRIGNYAAILLAGQESISDAQIEQLLRYVRNGGNLIILGNTGQFNEWRENRRTNPFRAAAAKQNRKGSISYIPEVIPADLGSKAGSEADNNPEITAASGARGHSFLPSRWILPKNHEAIYESIKSACPKGFSVECHAPLTTVMEIVNRPSTRETIVHFVNFDHSRVLPGFSATVRKQYDGEVKSVKLFSPDADEPKTLAFQNSSGRINFAVPGMKLYSMVVIAHA